MRLHNLHIVLAMLLLLTVGESALHAQIPIKMSVTQQAPPDSADVAYYGKKHFWRAAGEVVGFNVGLWAYDRFIQHGDYSYISFHTIGQNFKHGFIWDNDKLGTNTFLHPYNGSLYYNAARSNGYNYWQSSLFAISGSAMWELFMEREYPSTNDIIATPIGGTVLGEMLYRASDAIVDDRATGGNRFLREAGIFIISPMRGITRLVKGDSWRVRATRGRTCGVPNIGLRVSLGMRMMDMRGATRHPYFGATAQFDLEYGDRFEPKSTKPFDYFVVKAVLQGMKYQPVLNEIQVKGRLLSREIIDKKNSSGSLGLYQHFDFYDSDTIRNINKIPYKLGIPASLGAGFMYRNKQLKDCVFDTYLHANGIILGSILSDHYQADERTYNWASGFSIKGGFNFVFKKNFASVAVTHEFYRLFTWSGYRYGTDLSKVNFRTLNVMGDRSVASFNVTELRFDLRLYKKLYGTLSFTNRYRSTHYRDFDPVKSRTTSLQLMATYKF